VPGPDSGPVRRAGKGSGIIGQTCLQRIEEKRSYRIRVTDAENENQSIASIRTKKVAYLLINFSTITVNFIDIFLSYCND